MPKLCLALLPVVVLALGFSVGRTVKALPGAPQAKVTEPAPDLLKVNENRLLPDLQFVMTNLSTRGRARAGERPIYRIEDDRVTLRLRRQAWTGGNFERPYIYQTRTTVFAPGERTPLTVLVGEPVVMRPGKLVNEIIPIEVKGINPGDYDVEFSVYEPAGHPKQGEDIAVEGGRFWRMIHCSGNEIAVR